MNIYLHDCWVHPMNIDGLRKMIDHLGMQIVQDPGQADVIYSASVPLNTTVFPEAVFIFGPHFSIFPGPAANMLFNPCKNAVYIQPSQPSVDTWVNEFQFRNVPVKAFAFPVEIPDISPEQKDSVLLYYKSRDPADLAYAEGKLKELGVKYELVSYGSYNEIDYQKLLDRTKYAVWVGRHESQGFALESALAKDIPILVWNVTRRTQEINCPAEFHTSGFTPVTTIPYWSDSCGEYFFEAKDFEETYQKFVKKLDDYRPRDFVKSRLSLDVCSKNFLSLIDEIRQEMKK